MSATPLPPTDTQPHSLLADFSASAFTMGVLASIVGFSSSFAIVLAALAALGATPAQAATGLLAASLAMGLCGVWFALRHRAPISVAWSTPGAALLIGAPVLAGGYNEAIGAFIICALLINVTGLVKPIGEAIKRIPRPLANAMLAGILLPLCLAPFRAAAEMLFAALPIIAAWAIALRVKRLFAVPVALIVFAAVLASGITGAPELAQGARIELFPSLQPIAPIFSLSSIISVALPVYVVTMASQNIPGIAVLAVNGYDVRAGALVRDTGVISLLSAPFGAIPSNLSAIVASMCCGEDVHPDRSRRYWAALIAGLGYILMGLLAGPIAGLLLIAPASLIATVAGLALVPTLLASAGEAFAPAQDREAAGVTFLTAASGITLLGISGAFWGLVAGGLVYWLLNAYRKGAT
ncbi:benzoate/H(+) symporter BenE family transporter [Pseudahrensia aquimaris]|uniref:Benzoate/H(+) symporter BenE family transporter n=1 Tax=Pseudahrensia aquimaris TaxID=744461 RepID=A0ABW3FJT9_9HYPH